MLYFLVEGINDRRFVDRVVVPLLADSGECIDIYEYASKSPKEVDKFLRALDAMCTDYIFVSDRDLHPCITRKKESLCLRYGSLRRDRISIADCEIESWYVGGMTDRAQKQLRIRHSGACEKVTKERFATFQCSKYPTSIALMTEILVDYSVSRATSNSKSFSYLLSKHLQFGG